MKLREWTENIGLYGAEGTEVAPLRLLLYGEPGAGKTYFALGAPDPWIIDTDRGVQTAKAMGITLPGVRLSKDDDVFRITKDVLLRLRDSKAPFDEHPPKTIIIDSLMSLADYLLYELMVRPEGRIARRDPLVEKAEYDHWGALQNRLRDLLDITKDLPCHIIATAGIKLEKNEYTGSVFGLPAIQGGFRDIVGHFFDEFFFMQPSGSGDRVKYMTYTRKYDIYAAKSRTGRPPKMENASFKDLMEDPSNGKAD